MLAVDRSVEFAKGAQSSISLVSIRHLYALRFGRLHLQIAPTGLAACLILITSIFLLVEAVLSYVHSLSQLSHFAPVFCPSVSEPVVMLSFFPLDVM